MMTDSHDSERFSEGWDEHARKTFLLMDPKEDKYILGNQLEYYFQVIGENPTRAEIQAALQAVGKTETDQFTFDDCVSALKSFVAATVSVKAHLISSDVVRIVNQHLDPNGTGVFTKDALMRLLVSDGSSNGHTSLELLTKDEMEQILSELKVTDGTVQAADFFSLLLDDE